MEEEKLVNAHGSKGLKTSVTGTWEEGRPGPEVFPGLAMSSGRSAMGPSATWPRTYGGHRGVTSYLQAVWKVSPIWHFSEVLI